MIDKEIKEDNNLASFKPLKEFAKMKLPQSSMLRELLLLEQDVVQIDYYKQKAVLYRKMLLKEMRS